ncbi:hypothetical protein E4T56_gene17038 [Termitomyces sp. T112]|nr:hypothetical protein E4T56_gene17038 [Termitomyces sp. T112]
MTCLLREEEQVFSGEADGAGRMLDVATGQGIQVAQCDATIKVVRWVDAPGSSTLRRSNAVATVNLPKK